MSLALRRPLGKAFTVQLRMTLIYWHRFTTSHSLPSAPLCRPHRIRTRPTRHFRYMWGTGSSLLQSSRLVSCRNCCQVLTLKLGCREKYTLIMGFGPGCEVGNPGASDRRLKCRTSRHNGGKLCSQPNASSRHGLCCRGSKLAMVTIRNVMTILAPNVAKARGPNLLPMTRTCFAMTNRASVMKPRAWTAEWKTLLPAREGHRNPTCPVAPPTVRDKAFGGVVPLAGRGRLHDLLTSQGLDSAAHYPTSWARAAALHPPSFPSQAPPCHLQVLLSPSTAPSAPACLGDGSVGRTDASARANCSTRKSSSCNTRNFCTTVVWSIIPKPAVGRMRPNGSRAPGAVTDWMGVSTSKDTGPSATKGHDGSRSSGRPAGGPGTCAMSGPLHTATIRYLFHSSRYVDR